jgi:FkbM family methyltransferase
MGTFRRYALSLSSIALIACIFSHIHTDRSSPNKKESSTTLVSSTLSFDVRGCAGVYLDIGTNIGVQIRKLYDPHLFPRAKVLPIFDRYFGEDRRHVCAIGFEPNPKHTGYLKRLQDNLVCRGRRVHIYTSTAAATNTSKLTFYSDSRSPKERHEWAASLIHSQWTTNSSLTVQGIDLAEFIMTNVLIPLHRVHFTREENGLRVPIVMKMDIEGSEYGVILHLLAKGVLCELDFGMLEWHPWFFTGVDYNNSVQIEHTLGLLLNHSSRYDACNVTLADLDDETYGTEGFKMPNEECGSENHGKRMR